MQRLITSSQIHHGHRVLNHSQSEVQKIYRLRNLITDNGKNVCYADVWTGLSPIVRSAPKNCSRHLILHQKCVSFESVRDLSKRGRQRQRRVARKLFLCNPRILLRISGFTFVTLYVSIFEIPLTPASPPERNDGR